MLIIKVFLYLVRKYSIITTDFQLRIPYLQLNNRKLEDFDPKKIEVEVKFS